MADTLILPARLAAAIVEHAQGGLAEEVCGLVAGLGHLATEVFPGRNISPTPASAYELDHETLARMIGFEDAGLELVAIYHSHPRGPGHPSSTDIARAAYPDSVYLIVSLAEPDRPTLRGFTIKDDLAQEIEVLDDPIPTQKTPADQRDPGWRNVDHISSHPRHSG